MRDASELHNSPFSNKGKGVTFSSIGLIDLKSVEVKSNFTAEELSAFVQTIRRLYMHRHDQGGFTNSFSLFLATQDNQLIKDCLKDFKSDYDLFLDEECSPLPIALQRRFGLKRAEVLSVFFYSQFAHQPDARQEKAYHRFVKITEGNPDLLFYLFYGVLRELKSFYIDFFNMLYFAGGGEIEEPPNEKKVGSVLMRHKGLGILESESAKLKRVIEENLDRSVVLHFQGQFPSVEKVLQYRSQLRLSMLKRFE